MTPARPRLSVVLAYLAGRPGLLLVGVVLLAYAMLALAPFRWAPPRRVDNAATADVHGIRFPAAGLAHTREAPDWLERAAALGSLRLELRVRTHAVQQGGPARIFTVSRDLHLANLTLAQAGPDLVLRLRHPGTTPAGKPPYRVRGVFRDTAWHDVGIAIAPGSLKVVVDGGLAVDAALPERPLADWSPGHLVAIGNELNGLRPWRGEVARALVDVDGKTIDYARPGALTLPERFWSFANRPRWLVPDEVARHSLEDWGANFAAFVVLGFLLGALGGARGSWRRALAICALASLGVEIAQGFFSRHPDSIDWVLNTLGGGAGAGIARWLVGRALRPLSLVGMALTLTAVALCEARPVEAFHAPMEGFGAVTTGGAGRPECVVSSLDDGGPRTLRACLVMGHRHVTFAVAGTIHLASQLSIGGPFVTVDGLTAPSPGITLKGFGLNIWDQHDVVVRGLRIRGAGGGFSGKSSTDCIGMKGPGTYNVVIDHVSIHDCADGGIDITAGPTNITIQWSIVSTRKAMLWGSTSSSRSHATDRISMHHTALICGPAPLVDGAGCDRFPLIRASGYDLKADLRRNVFSGWLRANGTKVEPAAWVNVVGNAYIPAPHSTFMHRQHSIAVNPGTRVHTAGNVELGPPPRPDLNANGNEARPLPAPPITERELGCVVHEAGMHPRDAVDQQLLSVVSQVPGACAEALASGRRDHAGNGQEVTP